MLKTKVEWQQLNVSSDQTHHVIGKRPAYEKRFLSVLKFHPPGLAPVRDESGAFHIDVQGKEAYSERFLQTFGFYDGRSTVESVDGWHHVLADGSQLTKNRYAWCGNYVEGHCVVKEQDGVFFHIDREGEKAYLSTYPYVGDFHDGQAVVQNHEGFHSHINTKGDLVHGKWFFDLDVYHKGFARAKDEQGWFHIDRFGNPCYRSRYRMIEPFYNGVARVESHTGALLRLSEKGEILETLRRDLEDEFHKVSGDLVSFWQFYTLHTAIECGLFDLLPQTDKRIAKLLQFTPNACEKLLLSLKQMGYIDLGHDQYWQCTSKGNYLQSNHPFTLTFAAAMWKQEHLRCWQELAYSLQTGAPAFNHLYGEGWFTWLNKHPDQKELYHQAIGIYAKRDYESFCAKIDLSKHRIVMDVGGSKGILLMDILSKNPHISGILLDLPEVIKLVQVPTHLQKRMECVSGDFFGDWPPVYADAIILSRVLHDWPDKEALHILQNVSLCLSDDPYSRIYILEKVQNSGGSNSPLLDINMLLMTGGLERETTQFENLLDRAGLSLDTIIPLNEVSSILIAKKGDQ